jgi:hypothetical protein
MSDFQWLRDKLSKDGFSLSIPTGNRLASKGVVLITQ